MKNPLTAQATIAEVDEEIKIWLRGAPDRHGGRSERAKKERCLNRVNTGLVDTPHARYH